MADKYDPESLTEMLPFYYKRIFPYGPYLRWLFYGNCKYSHYLTKLWKQPYHRKHLVIFQTKKVECFTTVVIIL